MLSASNRCGWRSAVLRHQLQMSKLNSRLREPPPVLFLHPSAGASHTSLTSPTDPTTFISAQISTTRREQFSLERSISVRSGSAVAPDLPCNGRAGSSRSTDKTDALWAEMQATLEDIELSASGGTYVFGPGHSQKLFELRSAQIGLAQAWARSEADEMTIRDKIASSNEGGDLQGTLTDSAYSNVGDGLDQVRRLPYEGHGFQNERVGLSELDPTGISEMDVVLGRKRREANDKYFQKVNNGVIDVVAKLEDVTMAMHAVEQEGKHVWSEVGASC